MSKDIPAVFGLFVLVSIAVSVWGAIRLPADARVRIRVGGFGFDTWIGKTTALVLWPVNTAIIAGGAALATSESEIGGVIVVLCIAGCAIVILAQLATIRRAS